MLTLGPRTGSKVDVTLMQLLPMECTPGARSAELQFFEIECCDCGKFPSKVELSIAGEPCWVPTVLSVMTPLGEPVEEAFQRHPFL